MIKIIIEKEDIKEDTNEILIVHIKNIDLRKVKIFKNKTFIIKNQYLIIWKIKGKSNNKYTYKFREIEKTIYRPW